MQTAVITVDDLAVARRAVIVAEAAQVELMLAFDAQQAEASKHEVNPTSGLLARSMIPLEIGQAMELSEGQVNSILFAARTARDRTPTVWAAFSRGDVSFQSVREIAKTVDKLVEPESVTRLDARVPSYAADHTVAELRVWLRRFVVRVEADAATARAEAERADRRVTIEHGDDGMSWISAYLPSPAAAAIERRLHHEARKQPKDGRTLVQKEADLFAAWLTTNEHTGQAAAHADIAVIVDADVLAGARHGFAESPDGAWVAPTTWVTDLAHDPVWYRMVRDPITRDILSIDYRGRFAPEILKKALYFLHGTCAVPGCLIPAWKCEIDHQIPWPRGHTTAANTRPLSKAHHGQKGHGLVPAIRTKQRPPVGARVPVALPKTDARVADRLRC